MFFKDKKNILGATCFLLAIAGVALSLITFNGSKATAQRPPSGPVEVGVIVIKPETLTITTELPGRTSAYLIAEVRPQVSGIVQSRLFNEGSEVKAGQCLYQIDPATYQASFDSAKASLASAQANLNAAKPRAQRYRELLSSKAISQQDYDDVIATYQQSEAAVGVAKAALENARINLNYTKVISPINGRIGKSSVTPGALVTASQPNFLATVQQLDPIYVDITQASTEMLRLKRAFASGQLKRTGSEAAKVKLLFEDGAPYAEEGSLQFADITVDPTSAAITLRAIFPNPNGDLLPGMYVRAVLEEGTDESAILAPQQGISRDNKSNPIAMVVGAGNKVEVRPLKLVRAIGNNWLVAEGLKDGDKLIVEGVQKARPGDEVIPVPATNVSVQEKPKGNAPGNASAPAPQTPNTSAKPKASN